MKLTYLSLVGVAIVLVTAGCFMAYYQSRDYLDRVSVQGNDLLDIPVVGRLVILFSAFNTGSLLEDVRVSVLEKLERAGRPGGNIRPEQFMAAVELASLGMFLFLGVVIWITGNMSVASLGFLAVLSIMVAMLGFMWLESLVADRRTAVSRQFPYFMDMAVMSMEAGASFQETLAAYVRDNEGEPLADDLSQVLAEMQMGKTLTDALQGMNERTSTPLVQNALLSIIQGERMGTPVAQVLSEQSETIRFARSQTAERLAEEIKVRMQGPAMLLLISVLLLILGPAFIDVANSNVF